MNKKEQIYYLGQIDGEMPIGILDKLHRELGLEFLYNKDDHTHAVFIQHVEVVVK